MSGSIPIYPQGMRSLGNVTTPAWSNVSYTNTADTNNCFLVSSGNGSDATYTSAALVLK